MITMEERNIIFSDFKRLKKNSEVARIHDVSRTTIIKLRKEYETAKAQGRIAYEELIGSRPKYKKDRESPKRRLTTPMIDYIDKCIAENANKRATGRKKQQMKGKDIYRELCRQGYDISYKTVCNYLKKQKQMDGRPHECFIRQEYVPGERIEFDWGEVHITIAGIDTKYYMGVMSMCSNGYQSKLFSKQDTLAMMEMHNYGFKQFGHIPEIMVYDNMRTAVKSFVGGEKTPTEALSRLMGFYGFSHQFCNAHRGNEKGHTERAVEIVRRLAFSIVDTFNTKEEADQYLERICKEHNEALAEKMDEEFAVMRKWTEEMSCHVAEYRKVDKLSTFCYDTQHYSVPAEYVGGSVWIKAYTDQLRVFDTDGIGSKQIAAHIRHYGCEDWWLDINHYLNVLMVKPGALRNSVAFSQMPNGIKKLYEIYFKDKTKSFIELLMWTRSEGHSYQELVSAVRMAEMKGARDISSEMIKSVVSGAEEGLSLKSTSSKIDDGAGRNLIKYGILFKSQKKDSYGSNIIY